MSHALQHVRLSRPASRAKEAGRQLFDGHFTKNVCRATAQRLLPIPPKARAGKTVKFYTAAYCSSVSVYLLTRGCAVCTKHALQFGYIAQDEYFQCTLAIFIMPRPDSFPMPPEDGNADSAVLLVCGGVSIFLPVFIRDDAGYRAAGGILIESAAQKAVDDRRKLVGSSVCLAADDCSANRSSIFFLQSVCSPIS